MKEQISAKMKSCGIRTYDIGLQVRVTYHEICKVLRFLNKHWFMQHWFDQINWVLWIRWIWSTGQSFGKSSIGIINAAHQHRLLLISISDVLGFIFVRFLWARASLAYYEHYHLPVAIIHYAINLVSVLKFHGNFLINVGVQWDKGVELLCG